MPLYVSCVETYKEAGSLSLDDYRKLASSRYLARSSSVPISNRAEFRLKSDQHFPNRAKSIASLATIGTYTSD